MVEHYDVVIIGAGIAGCALAYNLKKIKYKGKVLILDKNQPGHNQGHGHRIVLTDLRKEYNVKILKEYKGIKICTNDKIHSTINAPFYSFDYKDSCQRLINDSKYLFKNEEAIFLNEKKKKIITNKKVYAFDFLIDCSGTCFFLRKKFNLPIPDRYWLGNVKKIIAEKDCPYEKDYFYYALNDNLHMEELSIAQGHIYHGHWQHGKELDYSTIKPVQNNLLNKLKEPQIIQEYHGAAAIAFKFPLVHKNHFGFIGDSFGNAFPGSGFGVEVAIETSKMMAHALKKNNLNLFKKEWKKRFYKLYILHLASKEDRYSKSKFIKYFKRNPKISQLMKFIKKNPNLMIQIMYNHKNAAFPKEIKQFFSPIHFIWIGYYLLHTKIKYALMDLYYS